MLFVTIPFKRMESSQTSSPKSIIPPNISEKILRKLFCSVLLKSQVIIYLVMSTPRLSWGQGQGMSVGNSVFCQCQCLGNSVFCGCQCLYMLCVNEKVMHVWTFLAKTTNDIHVNLPANVDGSVELNQNMLCVYGFLNGYNSGMTEHTNLELQPD